MGANNLVQWNKVLMEGLFILANELAYADKAATWIEDGYRDRRHGTQITVKKPPRYTIRNGDAAQTQGITEENVVVTIQEPFGVDLQLSGEELDLITGSRPENWNYLLRPAMSQCAAHLDSLLAQTGMNGIYNYVGTPGTSPATVAAGLAPQTRLTLESVPKDSRYAILGPIDHAALVAGLTGNFAQNVVKMAEQYNSLKIPLLGLANGLAESQSTPSHTNGTLAGTPVVDGNGQSGSTLNIRGATAGTTLLQGDVITIASVNMINRQTRLALPVLRNFLVTADTTVGAGGTAAVPVYPPINPPIGGVAQQYQTVDAFPVDGAAITRITGNAGAVVGEGIYAHKDCIGLVSIPMFKAPNQVYCEDVSYKGINMRLWVGADIQNNRMLMRIDMRVATPMLYPEAGCRVAGA